MEKENKVRILALNQLVGTPVLRSLGVVEGYFQRRYSSILNRPGSLIVANEPDGPLPPRAFGKMLPRR